MQRERENKIKVRSLLIPWQKTPLIAGEVVARYAAEQTTMMRVANPRPSGEYLARIIIRSSFNEAAFL